MNAMRTSEEKEAPAGSRGGGGLCFTASGIMETLDSPGVAGLPFWPPLAIRDRFTVDMQLFQELAFILSQKGF